MKKSNVITKILALLVTLSLVLSLTACGGGDTTSQGSQTAAVESGSQTQSTQSVQSEKPKEPVTITCLIREVGTKWNNYPDNPISEEIKKQTGVTFKILEVDDNKYKVLIAGGDLPDMMRVSGDRKQLIEGNLIIPLDDLVKSNGQNIQKNIQPTIDYMKKFVGDDSGKLYVIPCNVGHDAIGFQLGLGILLRWDYYKEQGYPEIKSEDDLLGILAQMQKLHPTAENGKKVYGVGMFNDGGTWPLIYPMASIYGYRGLGTGVFATKSDTNDIVCNVTDMNAPMWKAITFYYKANKMGLLDPDSFTMKFNDLAAKCNNGQILYQAGLWSSDLNSKLSKDGKGFMAIPVDVGFQWCGAYYAAGWFSYAITKSCKNPERAMDLMNYLWSYDGSRTLRSGVKGIHWDVVDGKPQLKDDAIALKSAGGEAWDKTGIDMLINFAGLSEFEVNPDDNTVVNLFNTAKAYTTMMNPLYKDFCDYYGVSYPAEAFYKKLDEGKNFNEKNMNPLISGSMPTVPDDIARIDAKLLDIITKGSAKCILSKSDADFEANKKAVLDELVAAGVDKSIEWNTKAWTDAKAAVGAK